MAAHWFGKIAELTQGLPHLCKTLINGQTEQIYEEWRSAKIDVRNQHRSPQELDSWSNPFLM
jgi:septation ring formation regulator EzrA